MQLLHSIGSMIVSKVYTAILKSKRSPCDLKESMYFNFLIRNSYRRTNPLSLLKRSGSYHETRPLKPASYPENELHNAIRMVNNLERKKGFGQLEFERRATLLGIPRISAGL